MKIAGSVISDNFLEHSLKQTNIFARRIVSQTLFATNKAKNVYSIGTYSAPEATQIQVKVYRKMAKSHIFGSISFFYSSTFSGYKDVCRAGNGRRVYQPEERLASNREIGKS